MNIYKREMRANLKSLIIWSIAMLLLVVIEMQEYNTFAGNGANSDAFMNMIESMPKFIKNLWGVAALDIKTPIGYFGVLFSYLILMAAIHAGMLGANIIAKEEREKTAEFLMTKPISRNKIITSKIMAALTNILVFDIVTFVTSIVVIKGFSTAPIATEMVLSFISMFLIQILFMMIGIGIASLIKNPKRSVALAMSIILGTFVLSILVDMLDKLSILIFLTPFKYFEAKDFLVNGNLNVGYIILTVGLIISLLIVTYKKYKVRDLNL